MKRNRPVGTPFREGDQVVLAESTYPGTAGVFLRLKQDINWADITERNGNVRPPCGMARPLDGRNPDFHHLKDAHDPKTRCLNRDRNARMSEQQHRSVGKRGRSSTCGKRYF